MKPYDPKAKCPKCGCEEVRTVYEAAGTHADIYHRRKQAVLMRTCARCHFSWDEAPKDAAEKKED